MLEAFKGLEGDHLRLVVAGQRHQFYEGVVGNEAVGDARVLMHEGKVPIDKLQVYFHAGDVAVFPYRDALTSGAIITALGFGCPIIATRVGCIRVNRRHWCRRPGPPGQYHGPACRDAGCPGLEPDRANPGRPRRRPHSRLGPYRPPDHGSLRPPAHRLKPALVAVLAAKC